MHGSSPHFLASLLPARRSLASAPSRLNFRVEPLQFDRRFVDGELPIDSSLFLGDAGVPRGNFGLQRLEVADAPVFQALAGHATQLAFRHVEPTAVLGGVNEVDPADILPGLVWRKCFVECPLGVRVQIVADQRDSLDAGVTSIEQMGDFMSPVLLGA